MPTVSAHYGRDGKVVLPDANLTPGAVLTTDKAKICEPGYTKTVPEVPKSEKQQVFALYGVRPSTEQSGERRKPVRLELRRSGGRVKGDQEMANAKQHALIGASVGVVVVLQVG